MAEQRKFICSNIDELSRQDATDVYRFININCPKAKFSIHSDGCSVNLDKLSDDFIGKLYTYMKGKLDCAAESHP